MELLNQISNRIGGLRKRYAYTINEVIEDLNISRAEYKEIENSGAGLQVEHLLKLASLYQKPLSYFFLKEPLEQMDGRIPFIPVKAHAGFIKSYSNDLIEDEYDFYRIPGYYSGIGYKLFEIEGDSMAPTLESGDIVICQDIALKKLKARDTLVVITKEKVLVKRFMTQTRDNIVFTNDNPFEDEELTIPNSKLILTCLILGKITNKLVPSHQMISSRKIDEMTEALEFLKQEVSRTKTELKK
ncbi:LexA family transcriptional regulator [Antarcticibacterium flavum]|uniref:LexA family transcriptional regulator n=1 Tax=Antarcticibacterium flavum TaxID=2058175 RepID=A0A5B7X967_9FLAO|nr:MULTISPECIES: LexA family transcriptional regulator [Antarcticibacterium]MCM4161769.1 hypothetical protein [Antarcticibacterium sp. W02-3]QCY71151.1 LexA family transcriptional regulator [Antarcticibacterium flavum]